MVSLLAINPWPLYMITKQCHRHLTLDKMDWHVVVICDFHEAKVPGWVCQDQGCTYCRCTYSNCRAGSEKMKPLCDMGVKNTNFVYLNNVLWTDVSKKKKRYTEDVSFFLNLLSWSFIIAPDSGFWYLPCRLFCFKIQLKLWERTMGSCC